MAKPLLDVVCITEESCEYPTALRVNMDDGTVQTYVLQYDTHPNFKEAIDALNRMFESVEIVGYRYKEPKKRRNRSHR